MSWKSKYSSSGNSPQMVPEIQYNPNQNPSKLFCNNTEKWILKHILKLKGARIAKTT